MSTATLVEYLKLQIGNIFDVVEPVGDLLEKSKKPLSIKL